MAQTLLVLVPNTTKINADVIHAAKKELPSTLLQFGKIPEWHKANPFLSLYRVTETFMNGHGNAAYVRFEW